MLLLHLLVIMLMVLLLNHDLRRRLVVGMGAGQELWVDVMGPLREQGTLRALRSFCLSRSVAVTSVRWGEHVYGV